MARPSLPVAGPKRRPVAPIIPLGGALAATPSPGISKMLGASSPALSRPRATVTPPALQGKRRQRKARISAPPFSNSSRTLDTT